MNMNYWVLLPIGIAYSLLALVIVLLVRGYRFRGRLLCQEYENFHAAIQSRDKHIQQERILLDYAHDMDDYSIDITHYKDAYDGLADLSQQIAQLRQQTAPMPPVVVKRQTRAKTKIKVEE